MNIIFSKEPTCLLLLNKKKIGTFDATNVVHSWTYPRILPFRVLISRKSMLDSVLKALLIPIWTLIRQKLMPGMVKCSAPSH